MSTFSQRLREARTKAGLSQEAIALELGVTKSAVSNWERDDGYPSFELLPKLRGLLRVSLDTLLCDEPAVAGSPGFVREELGLYRLHGEEAIARTPQEFKILQRYRALADEPRKQRAWLELLTQD